MRRILHIVLLALIVGAVDVHAQSSQKKLESERARLQQDIELLNRKLDDNSRSSERALTQLTLVRSKIAKREALIAECDRSLRQLNDSIKTCQAEMERLQARYDTLSFYYGRLVRGAYKNRDSRMWYMYVLSSESMGQAFRRLGYLRSLSSQMNTQAQHIQEASAALEVERERLLVLKGEADQVRSQMVQERARLRDEETESARIATQLQRDRKKYQQQIKEKNKQIEALNRKIEQLIREQASGKGSGSGKKGSSKGKTTSTAVDTKLSGQFAANKGKLPWPVAGVVVERFGKHRHPVYENVELPQNNGVTLTVKRGTEAKAVFDGKVTQIFVLPGYNQCVLVSHGEYFTLYTKLKTVAVKAGNSVKTGQVIGTVDTIAGEDLFHFELWKGSTPLNPESWLRP
ncbi:MAG: peptidoglycan DD-metalloendopeptidase family protein [Bacteroidales bacterium]|nr:peptidoglycan DD-metalloendopeptidase family protein [Bacteroidales bacterium]